MSVDTIKEDFWQTTARSTIREKCEGIFNQELLSDVNFVVRDSQGGSERKTIPAHKFVLAISSPVFYAMFYGELAEMNVSVEITDCDYESLLELFRFMYSDKANLKPNNVMELLYLAKKYMLPSLADKCSVYLQDNLDGTNVFHVLPNAQKYEEKDLLDHCWKVIETETEEAVKSDGFVTIERLVLEQLVENDSLDIKEVELFKAVDCWAIEECEKQGVVAEGSVKRRILGERIVKGIRFPVMEEKDFASVVLDCDILTKKESYDMMKYFNSVLTLPLNFPAERRVGCIKIMSRFRSLKSVGWRYYSGISNSICFSVDKDIKLHEVRLFGSDNSEYSVNLTVKDANDVVIATEKGNFLSKHLRSEIGYYQGFSIVFEPPIGLVANTEYNLKAFITGPSSFYGESGLTNVEHSGVNFVFKSTNSQTYINLVHSGGTPVNTKTTVGKGQFSEFVFTLY